MISDCNLTSDITHVVQIYFIHEWQDLQFKCRIRKTVMRHYRSRFIFLMKTNLVFGAIERESTKMVLAVNEGKTKYMFSISRDVRHVDSRITADNYTFDTVKEFIYLGSAVDQTKDHSCQQVLLWSQWAIK